MNNKVKKISVLIQLRFMYIYLLLYIISGYFYQSKLKNTGFYDFGIKYFGVTSFFILLVATINIYSFFIKCKKKKMVFGIRMNFLSILIFSSLTLYLMFKMNLPFSKITANDEIIRNFIDISIYKYKFGLVMTFIVYQLLLKVPFIYLYLTFVFLVFISCFFIGAKSIRTTIKKVREARARKIRLEKERKSIQEQIKLQEIFEKKEREAREREKITQQNLELYKNVEVEEEVVDKINDNEKINETEEGIK